MTTSVTAHDPRPTVHLHTGQLWLVKAWGGHEGQCYGYRLTLTAGAGSVLREVSRDDRGRNKDGRYDSVVVLYRAEGAGNAAVEVDQLCESKPSVNHGFCDLLAFLASPIHVVVS